MNTLFSSSKQRLSNTLFRLAAVLIGVTVTQTESSAADIASCSNPSGVSYYPETGAVTEKNAGWHKDKISNGTTKLIKQLNGTYDILYMDVRKEIISSRQEGGQVLLLSRGENVASILVVYPGKLAEIFTFLRTNTEKLQYIHTLSKAGDGVLITKASVMHGACDYINFDAL